MSTEKIKELFGFGARLTEERNRLGLSQKNLAAILGKTFVTQSKYESEETKPDAIYLMGLDKLGADIYYIVTGTRSANKLPDMEQHVLDAFRNMDERGRSGVLALIAGLSQPGQIQNNFHNRVGQVLEGDITGSQTINVGDVFKSDV